MCNDRIVDIFEKEVLKLEYFENIYTVLKIPLINDSKTLD
jgi:hypothetical protein